MSVDSDVTVEKTQWTQALVEDLCTALRNGRDDETVRGFARELIDDKDMPLQYLVRKVERTVGAAQAERLEIIVLGRRAAAQARNAQRGPLARITRVFKKLIPGGR